MSDCLTPHAISMELLVHGYIRGNETVSSDRIHGYIPHYLKEIFASFITSTDTAFYLSKKEPNIILITNTDYRISGFRANCKARIISLNSKSGTGIPITSEGTFAITTSINLPTPAFRAIRKYKQYTTNDFQAMFRMNRGSPSAYLVHRNEIKYNEDNCIATAFKWNLPTSPYQSACINMIYDNDYGLIVFNGWKPDLSYLSFKSNKQSDWKWKYFDFNTKYSIYGLWRRKGSVVMIKTYDNKKKLFVCGGTDISCVDFYDFKCKRWTSSTKNFKPMDAGICYDNMTQNIYVGGGDVKGDHYRRHCQVQKYDLMKNQWYQLPDTGLKHANKPIMYIDRYNRNLLYIGCQYENNLEYIDLRATMRRWTLISDPKQCVRRY